MCKEAIIVNKINIGDTVKTILPQYPSVDKVTCKVISMFLNNGKEILYTGEFMVACPDGGESYKNTVQFKEGEYEVIDHYGNGDLIITSTKDQKPEDEVIEEQENISEQTY